MFEALKRFFKSTEASTDVPPEEWLFPAINTEVQTDRTLGRIERLKIAYQGAATKGKAHRMEQLRREIEALSALGKNVYTNIGVEIGIK